MRITAIIPKLFLLFAIIYITSEGPGIYGQPSGNIGQVVLTGLQMDVSNNINKNLEQIIEGIRQAAGENADFLVTPEGSLSGYTSDFNQPELADALKKVTGTAKEMHVGLMLGTCYKESIKGKEYCFNQVRIYSPDGNFEGTYSKILRCSNLELPGTGEMNDYVEGELKVFNLKGTRFGFLICNDLWATPGYTTIPNPYLPWKLKQMGAQFIVHCINSGTDQRYKPFHESSAELWAYSLHIPIMEVNAAHGENKINARSGLIEATGTRSVDVPDSGVQSFKVTFNGSLTDRN
jgi:predicted amidohydrolase